MLVSHSTYESSPLWILSITAPAKVIFADIKPSRTFWQHCGQPQPTALLFIVKSFSYCLSCYYSIHLKGHRLLTCPLPRPPLVRSNRHNVHPTAIILRLTQPTSGWLPAISYLTITLEGPKSHGSNARTSSIDLFCPITSKQLPKPELGYAIVNGTSSLTTTELDHPLSYRITGSVSSFSTYLWLSNTALRKAYSANGGACTFRDSSL